MIDTPLPEGSDRFSGRVDGPTKRISVEVCELSIAQFPVLARPRVEVSLEPTKMANRSPERFGDFVRRIRKQKNLSLEAVSRQSARFGPKIAGSYISRIENEPGRKITADRLTALANGLGIPAEELFARATGLIAPGGKSEEQVRLLSMFKELSPERKVDVLEFVEMLHSKESSRRSSRTRSA
jgi:transcriptional regulator with XRE-family HTH domain